MAELINVLIVDDSESDYELIIRQLEKGGYSVMAERVETAAPFKAALEKQLWDIIIADYNLPQFDAPSALAIYHESKLDIPFIVVSGAIGEETAVTMMKSGAHDYLMKNNLVRLAPAVRRELAEVQVRRERKKADDELFHSKQILQLILNNIPHGVFCKDLNLRFLWCNQKFADFAGITSDIVGKDDFAWAPKDYAEIFQAEDREFLKQGVPVINLIKKSLFPQAHMEWLQMNKIALHDKSGNIFGILGTIEDITERKQADDALRSAKDAAEAASKAKSEFLATVSHEIRTPLNGILGFCDILTDSLTANGIDNVAGVSDALKIINQCGDTLLEIINDVLELSSIEAGQFNQALDEFSPLEVMRQSISSFDFKAQGKKIELNFIQHGLPAKVIGDSRRLKQINFNLIGNAVKFTLQGSVDVSADFADDKSFVKIKDTGIGIPQDKLETIMQPFYQVNQSSVRKFGGTGLGLAIVSRMLEKLNGSIKVESVLNKGTTVSFTFPVKLPKIMTQTPSSNVSSKVNNTLNGLTVLAVEDDPISIKYMDKILSDAGVEFKIADSYSAMLKICAEGLVPDVALLDIALPDSDGFECIKWLKKNINGKQPKFIAQTAHVFSVDQTRYMKAGFDSFIGKPYSKDELIEAIANVI